MNRDSQKIFENYVAEAIGTQQGQAQMAEQDPSVQQNQPAAAAPAAAPTQTEMLAGIIANDDQQFLEQLFALPGVQELMKSKLQPAQGPAVPAAPAAPVAPAPEPQAIPGGELGNPPLQTQ